MVVIISVLVLAAIVTYFKVTTKSKDTTPSNNQGGTLDPKVPQTPPSNQ